MRLEVGPAEVTVTGGAPISVIAQVFNSDDVINAYEIRVFGVDPSWVELERERLSLFPSSSGVVTVQVTVPDDYPAGALQLGVEVTPVVDPAARQLGNVTLIVPPRKEATISVDPQSLMSGKTGDFNLTFTNEGNTPFDLELHALDPEAKVISRFNTGVVQPKRKRKDPPAPPAMIGIVPGEQVIIPVRTSARQPIMGSPASRLITFTAKGADNPLETVVSFVQKPILGRGLISLFGLLMAITIMALVLMTTLNRVVDVAKVDAALLKRAVEGAPEDRGIPNNPGTISGSVTQLSSGAPVQGATVELFPDDDPAAPIASAVTGSDGTYVLPYLPEGTYKVRFRGAGFLEIWFEDATSFEEATKVDVAEDGAVGGIDIVIGGLPGSIAGTVIADDAADATVSLQVPAAVLGSDEGGLLQEVKVGADGAFLMEEIPAPASYELVVSKPGYSTSTRSVNLAAAEMQEGVEIRLRRGDGVITGIVVDDDGDPLGSVAITATNTVDEVSTITLTNGDDEGHFTLRNLPTPATYTITFAKLGYATENLTLALAAGEERGPELVTLAEGTGSISGSVTLAGSGPVGGVSVTVSDGETTLSTETLSVGDVGAYILTNLPIPGTYTVTFSGNGLASQVRSVDLDTVGETNVSGVNASLTAATAVVSGTVSDPDGPIGSVAVELTDGETTLATRSADDPPGEYVLTGVAPGTYTLTFRQTGAVPSSVLVTLSAGEQRVVDVELKPQATISGTVRRAGDGGAAAAPLAGAQVVAYRVADFPSVVAASTLTGADGTYTLTDLAAPDEYVIEFSYPVGALPGASQRVLLDAGQQRTGVDAVITLAGEGDA